MPKGIEIEVIDDFAYLEFSDPLIKGQTLARLHEVSEDPKAITLDSGGTKRTYIVPADIARRAGLLDVIETVVQPVAKKVTKGRKAAVVL